MLIVTLSEVPDRLPSAYHLVMDNRQEVSDFLKHLRSRLTPERAGLAVYGGERRVAGLRREEVAQLAGVSAAYYIKIERGDLRGVSESVLYAIIRALNLNEAEASHLLDLASTANRGRIISRARPEAKISAGVQQLVDAMQDVPALVMNRLGTPVASNRLGRALFPDLFPEGEPALNHARYLFLDPRSRIFYLEWEKSARESASAMRLLAGQDPSDKAFNDLVSELKAGSKEFSDWWSSHTVRTHTSGAKRINHPVVGELEIQFEALALTSVPGMRLVTYLAEPATASADALNLLRSWSAVPQTA